MKRNDIIEINNEKFTLLSEAKNGYWLALNSKNKMRLVKVKGDRKEWLNAYAGTVLKKVLQRKI